MIANTRSCPVTILTIMMLSTALWQTLRLQHFTSPSSMEKSRNLCWQEVAEKKRHDLAAKIPNDWKLPDSVLAEARHRSQLSGEFFDRLLDADTLKITELRVEALLDAVHNGSVTAVDVTRAFCKRTAFAHQLVRI